MNPETDQEIIDDVLREPIRLRDFSRDVAPKHPRYKHLSNFDELAIFNLTNRLAELNFQRLARIIRQEREIRAVFSPLFEYQYRCANLSSLREVELIKWSLGQKVPSYPERPLPSQTEFNNLITRIFEPLGVGTSDWSMDFRTRGRFAARDRFGTPGSVESQFQSALYKVLPEVRSFQTRICADLLEVFKSRANQFMRDGTHLKLAARRSSDSNSDSKSDSN